MGRVHRVGEFAGLTGVSIRTLHHYDRIDLLRPSARTEAGYRLYAEADLLRLQQILTLRELGFRLEQIRDLLARADFDLVASLRIQRGALRDRIAELERIEASLAELLERRLASGQWDWALVASAAAGLNDSLTRKGANMHEYYTPDQMRQFEELRGRVPAEEIQAIEQGWTALLAELRANRDLDPASPRAQELADRWDRLSQATIDGYRGNQELLDAIAENYRQDRFAGFEGAPQAEDIAFIERVKEARKGGGKA